MKDPFPILREFTLLFHQLLHQKKISLQIVEEIFGDISAIEKMQTVGIMLDIKVYQQILYNVFLNSWKFNKQKGKIKISFSAHVVQKTKLKIVTEVEDNGEGMDKSKLKRLFKVFENVRNHALKKDNENGNATATSGCGLGLHLSMQLVQYLDGDIHI